MGVLLWGEKSLFLKTKGILEALARETRLPIKIKSVKNRFLHPVEAAEIEAGKEIIGFLGMVHPHLSEAFKLPGAGVLVLDFEKFAEIAEPWGTFTPVPSHPEIREEYSFTLPEKHPLGELIERLRSVSRLIREVGLSDRYITKEGERSVTLGVTFQSEEKGLSDEDVKPIREKISSLIRRSGGALRN